MGRKKANILSIAQIAKLQAQTEQKIGQLTAKKAAIESELADVNSQLAQLTGTAAAPVATSAPKAKKARNEKKASRKGSGKTVNELILEVINAGGGQASKKDIVAALVADGRSKGTADPSLSNLKKAGVVENVGTGQWALARAKKAAPKKKARKKKGPGKKKAAGKE